mmetsp:Transcript_17961/g.50052  ORF Transcript_17961/g.50052 Transcript_17961/m.50052 type:complete len:80 (-) Transcript_17961:1358-1597(-)
MCGMQSSPPAAPVRYLPYELDARSVSFLVASPPLDNRLMFVRTPLSAMFALPGSGRAHNTVFFSTCCPHSKGRSFTAGR